MAKPVLLKKAEFNPKLKIYLNLYVAMILLVSVITIPIIPLWIIIAPIFLNKYFERLECELTTRSLRFKKGFLVQIEKTVPLDKIQDLTFKEGPLLRMLGLSILKVETAGNSGTGVADLSLLGVVDAMEFRQMVFDQRDKVTDNVNSGDNGSDSMVEILSDIRDSIKSIEHRLAEK